MYFYSTVFWIFNVNSYISCCVVCELLSESKVDNGKVLPDNMTIRGNIFVVSLFLCSLDTDASGYVDSLIDTSVRHSPHFDWVVAHIGYNSDYSDSCIIFVSRNKITVSAFILVILVPEYLLLFLPTALARMVTLLVHFHSSFWSNWPVTFVYGSWP